MTSEDAFLEGQLAEQRHHYLDLDPDSVFPVPGFGTNQYESHSCGDEHELAAQERWTAEA